MSTSFPASASDASVESRYQRVKRILNEAQGQSDPNYGGRRRFWDLPLADFLEFHLYGIRMIAMAPEPDAPGAAPAGPGGSTRCQCPPVEHDSPPPAGESRSAASGLIQGLKGLAPFDGTQFPRLPWGGSSVTNAEIQFIAEWIDAGCPADDAARTLESVRESRLTALSLGHEAHPLSTKPVNEHRMDIGGLKVRKNVLCLSPEELRRYRAGIFRMHCYDDFYQDERSFNYWARIHASNCQHNWEQFLTWHRVYLYQFEKRLQDIDPAITLPYWDWTTTNQNWVVTNDPDTGEVPGAFQCWLDDEALAELKGQISPEDLAKLAAIKGKPYNSANRLLAAAGVPYTRTTDANNLPPVIQALQRVNPLWHRLRWPGGTNQTLFENYPRPEDIARILKIPSFYDFGSGPASDPYFGAIETIHNLMHLFSGGPNPEYKTNDQPFNRNEPQNGDMFSNSTTTFDPLFWSHHSYVDQVWDRWQKLFPGVGPDDATAVLPPFDLNVADSASTANLGYEYQLGSSVFETDSSVPMARFKSAAAGVHAHALNHHRRAEIRLSGVRYSMDGGGFLRIFLNEDDADASTPTKGNDHYVGYFALFAGGCVGARGHCMPPDSPTDKFDLRHRHSKTPGNIRIDATEAVRKLRAKGAKDFHIHVIALGVDGQPKPDALRLGAVSLNFFD